MCSAPDTYATIAYGQQLDSLLFMEMLAPQIYDLNQYSERYLGWAKNFRMYKNEEKNYFKFYIVLKTYI